MPVIPVIAEPPAATVNAPPPLSLYVHIPWCVQKCPYCDFNSHEAKGSIAEESTVTALIADLESALPLVWGRKIGTIFFGGGTPSLLSPQAIDRLLAAFRARLPVSPEAEITLEANPGTVEAARFAGFRAAGVNRVSLGIQSFDAAKLHALGRIHDGNEARRAAELAARHFPSFNIDLMVGLPGQSLADSAEDIATALAFSPPHLSCYQLTLEPNTRFAAFPPPDLPDADLAADMQEALEQTLAEAGYVHYETSAFARPGWQCRHNLNYWHFGDYLGIGAGAHTKLTIPDRILRQMRWKHPDAWLANAARGNPVQEERVVRADELPFEFLMNALRLNQGFPAVIFSERTRLPLSRILPALHQAADDGLLSIADGRIAPTEPGRRFLNRLLERFL